MGLLSMESVWRNRSCEIDRCYITFLREVGNVIKCRTSPIAKDRVLLCKRDVEEKGHAF